MSEQRVRSAAQILVGALLASAAWSGFGGAARAEALPDFTINPADSVVWGEGENEFADIGCGFDDFLSRGFIAIKNIGDGVAPRLPGEVVYTDIELRSRADGSVIEGDLGSIRSTVTGAVDRAAEGDGAAPRDGGPSVRDLFRGTLERAQDEVDGAEDGDGAASGGRDVEGPSLSLRDEETRVIRGRRVLRRKFVWAQIFNPYNPDLSYYISTRDYGPDELGTLDQKRFEFFVGQGRLKKYRNFTGETDDGAVYAASRDAAPSATLLNIQRALSLLGYEVDVDGAAGPQTTDAIKAYQLAEGAEATGVLTQDQKADLMSQLVESVLVSGAQSADTKVDIFVVIDPFNMVVESNEANNFQRWTISVDCSIEDLEATRSQLFK